MSVEVAVAAGVAAEVAEARAGVYGFLSNLLLAPPTEAALAKLQEPSFIAGVALGLGVRASSALEALRGGASHSLESLVQEHNDLFVVPLGRYVAPYEAVYRGAQEEGDQWIAGPLQGESTLAVLAKYREAGAEIDERFLDLPDHIGMELAFMQLLCELEAEARRRIDDEETARLTSLQVSFLKGHLAVWAPALCQRIREMAKTPLYKGVATLLEAYLDIEQKPVASGTRS
ncbi:MAG: molecular chaperone TorD family protein [Chloroflexi bacterium]|nr:molecular chaperone TorD family protein [Chloroflexota bacterium]